MDITIPLFFVLETTRNVIIYNIHYSSIAKVPSELSPVDMNGIRVKHDIDTYTYAHVIHKVMFPELVIHKKNKNLMTEQIV